MEKQTLAEIIDLSVKPQEKVTKLLVSKISGKYGVLKSINTQSIEPHGSQKVYNCEPTFNLPEKDIDMRALYLLVRERVNQSSKILMTNSHEIINCESLDELDLQLVNDLISKRRAYKIVGSNVIGDNLPRVPKHAVDVYVSKKNNNEFINSFKIVLVNECTNQHADDITCSKCNWVAKTSQSDTLLVKGL